MSNINKPCIKNCCLNEDDVCLGCFRTLDDMGTWHRSSDDEKREILKLADKRKNDQQNKKLK